MKKLYIYILLLLLPAANLIAQITVAGSNGADGNYTSLTVTGSGAFAAINANDQTSRNIVVTITGSSTSETGAITLGAGLWTSLSMYPTSSGLTISGSSAGTLIGLNGSDNVIIDGRVNSLGSTVDLIINNTNTGTSSTIRFGNSAENNIVRYCNIRGSGNSTTRGIISFTTAPSGNGNDNNTIEFNNISGNGANRPRNAIFSSGTTGNENSGIIIANNHIFDFLRPSSTSSNGIYVSTANSEWTITANSFYETSTFVPSVNSTYYIIRINSNTGDDYNISDNFIGGSAPSCGGTAWTKTAVFNGINFYGISLNVGTSTTSVVQNNTIQNFIWSNLANGNWYGIHIAGGNVDVGTGSGNIIGDNTTTSSIILTNTTSGGIFYGIADLSTGTVDINDNIIGGITTGNIDQANATSIYGIYKSASSGTTSIMGNTIGSEDTGNSVYASSGSTVNTQNVLAIHNLGTGAIIISDNIIANLTNGTTNTSTLIAGEMNGISSSSGDNTVTGNIIYELRNSNANANGTTNSSVCGISLSGTLHKIVTGNTIYNLSNDYDSFAGAVTGLYFGGGTTAENTISENFIHSLSVSSNSSTASIYGIRIGSGASAYSNNIITLGGNTSTTIHGIYQTGGSLNNNNLYFNTVYIGGSVASGTNQSYALYSTGTTNNRDFRNNILVNTRSTTGGSNLHFAIYFTATGGTGTLIARNNDYYVSGTGGTLGYYGGPMAALPVVTGQDQGSLNLDPGFASVGGTAPSDYIPSNNLLLAAPGTGITTDYAGITRSLTHPAMGAYEIAVIAKVDVYKSAVFQGSYSYLRDAFFDLNTGVLTVGDFEIRINASLTETASAVINASGTGGANYSSVRVFPTVSGLTIDGDFAAPLIDLNGADNITIDGRLNGTGSTTDLALINSSNSSTTGTSVVRFINDASSNTIYYCNIKGSSSGATSGIVLFSTSTGTTGNDNNFVSNNNITSATDTDRPVNAIYSAGTATRDNSGNTISNNNIYNFLNRSVATSYGVYLTTNNTAWTISGNSFYETAASFVPTATSTYYFIRILTTTGNNFTVSGNYIGGRAALCGGSALTMANGFDNVFFGILISTAAGTASNIQNNTIRNINWSNATTAIWTGIQVAGGDANIGTIAGNNIGNTTGTGSITVTNTTGSTIYGIYITSTGTIDCRNNNIGSITANNDATNRTNLYGIYKTGTGGTTINNNTIGSTSTANSINSASASTTAAQSVLGIYNGGSGIIDISGNTIANMTNGSANSDPATLGEINGISSTSGTNTVSSNIIHNLTNGNANNALTNDASVCGISLTTATLRTVSGNTIYNLSNSYDSFVGGVLGIYFSGGSGGNQISENFIHNLTVAGSSSGASVYGIRIASGTSTYSNNIISLGGNSAATLYGIYETVAAGATSNLYFNTVYISGNPTTGNYNSYSLYNASNVNTRNYRNNIFMNARSNNGATGKHYAIRLAGTTGLTIDYNDYYAPGTNGVLGLLGGDRTTLAAWRTATGQDINSTNINPEFTNAGGTTAPEYVPSGDLLAVDGTGITVDFGQIARPAIPTMGAWEGASNKWKGTTNTDWNTSTNWTKGLVPGTDANIRFDNSPSNDLHLDMNRSVNNIINSTSYKVVINSNTLSIKGGLVFSGGAQIDATTGTPTVEFAGASAQSIPDGAFNNGNQVYNLTVNNSNNVTFNGTLTLLNTLTVTTGLLDAITNNPTFRYAGTSVQTIEANRFLNERIYNLSIGNSAGVTLNTDFTVDNNLTISSGSLFTISATRLLTVTNTISNSAGNSGLVIKSDATGDAQLINNNANVPATVELYLTGNLASPGVGRYHYFVPPVESVNIGTTISSVATALSINNFGGSLLRYREPTSVNTKMEGWQYFDNYPGALPGFSTLESTTGYNFYHRDDNDVIEFRGMLNATQHTFNISYTTGNAGAGWNLIGNPYPCNYDLNGVQGLGTIVTGISNTVYYNNHGTYTYWNVFTNSGSSGGYTDILPPMTGFFVKLSSGGPSTLTLPVALKTPNTSDTRGLHKGSADPYSKGSDIQKVKLVLSKGSKADETIALLFDDANDSYNEHYDAYKLFATGSSSPDIYIASSGTDYFMKAVKGPVTDPVTIPMKVVVKEAGTHTITVTEFQNLDGIKTVLKHGAVETALSQGASYTFTSGTGTFTDFELILGEKGVTSVVEKSLVNEFKTWYHNDAMYINAPDEVTSGLGSIVIYDMQSKPVYNNHKIYLTAGETIQIPINLANGIFIVNITANGKSSVSKIVVF